MQLDRNDQLPRREFLALTAAAASAAVSSAGLAPSAAFAAKRGEEDERKNAPVKVSTFTYKKAGKVEIKLDVHRADDTKQRPLLVWIHGGALMVGHRESIDGRVLKPALRAGYAVASIDYRLAPETKLPEIIADVEDAFDWLRAEGAARFHADTSKIAVIGASAGGYLTLVTGHRVKPRPTVLVSIYGYGDLIGDWYSTPSPHSRHHRIKMSTADALKQVKGAPISDSRLRRGNGGAFYQYCRQRGIWPQQVSTWDPRTEAEKFFPYMPVKNVTKEYPPTLLVHGTSDTDVPYENSVDMAAEFKMHGVEHELVTIANGEHGFGGGDPKLVEKAYERMLSFIDEHMK